MSKAYSDHQLKFFRSVLKGEEYHELASLTLDDISVLHIQVHMLKNWPHFDADLTLPLTYHPHPSFDYVRLTNEALNAANSGLKSAQLAIRQIDHPPPSDWLDKIKTDDSTFVQLLVDITTAFVHSTLDKCLVLANSLLTLGLSERRCTFENVRRRLHTSHQPVLESIENLRAVTAPLAGPRNRFMHRGQRRKVETFYSTSNIQRMIRILNMSVDSSFLPEAKAKWVLQKTLRSEFNSVDEAFIAFKEALKPAYLKKIQDLGGLPRPTADEVKRFQDVLLYFTDGIRPAWMK